MRPNITNLETTMFIGNGGSRFINLDHVREGAVTNDGKTVFLFTDGKTTTLNGDYSRELPRAQLHVVPAAPGFERLTLWSVGEERREEIDSDPVIAWAIDRDNPMTDMPDPITADGGCAYSDDAISAVLCPNGAVVEPHSGRWANKETWLVGARKRLAEKRAAKAAANGASKAEAAP